MLLTKWRHHHQGLACRDSETTAALHKALPVVAETTCKHRRAASGILPTEACYLPNLAQAPVARPCAAPASCPHHAVSAATSALFRQCFCALAENLPQF